MRPTSVCWCLHASPKLWLKTLQSIPPKSYIPPRLNGNESQPYRAWLGDRILSAAFARAFDQSKVLPPSKFNATQLASIALSNQFMASRAKDILPETLLNSTSFGNASLSDRETGTLIEAAVAHVDEVNPIAVADLVSWLMEEAVQVPNPNAKGFLLSSGGSIETTEIECSLPNPIFMATAIAADGTTKAEAKGKSKREAEQAAASKLLGRCDIEYDEAIYQTIFPKQDERDESWIRFNKPDETFGTIVLKGETAESWWSRGASNPRDAFRRAMMTPNVFPEHIVAIDCWSRYSVSDVSPFCAFVVMVYRNKGSNDSLYYISPVHEAPSLTKARSLLAIKVNDFVRDLVA